MKFGRYVELIHPEQFCLLDLLFISYSFQDKNFQRRKTKIWSKIHLKN